MDASQALLQAYERLLLQTRALLTLAREGEGDKLMVLLQDKRLELIGVEQLRALDGTHIPSLEVLRRKSELLQQILPMDAEVRERLAARREELGRHIQVGRNQRSAHRAYSASAL